MISAVAAQCLFASANNERSHRWETIKTKATEAVLRVSKAVRAKGIAEANRINRVNRIKAAKGDNSRRNRNAAASRAIPARRVGAAVRAAVTTIQAAARAREVDPAGKAQGPAIRETRTDKPKSFASAARE